MQDKSRALLIVRVVFALMAPVAAQAAGDPFAGVVESAPAPLPAAESWVQELFRENFGFRREIMSQGATSEHARASSRQSVGFEVLKKFSSETATVASFDFQGRLVRRDRFVPVINEMEGMRRPGWSFEHHNLYLDLYNFLDPLMSDDSRGRHLGRFNARLGRFYVPFGLNLQTDTHGTILQLSNESSLGFERDWCAGLWGALNEDLNYDACALAGSGYDLKFKGQRGLGAGRVSLANHYSSEQGLEGGLSVLAGERLSSEGRVVVTRRTGIDARLRRPVPMGLVTGSVEMAAGRDASEDLFTQLYQAEYLRASRRWGLATQYRRFSGQGPRADGSIIGEATWYFRNDIGNSNLEWVKINVERYVERVQGPRDTIVALQYYRYW